MRLAFLVFILLLACYFMLRAIGEEGRSMVWKAVRPHLFPITAFLLLILFGLAIGISGLSIQLF